MLQPLQGYNRCITGPVWNIHQAADTQYGPVIVIFLWNLQQADSSENKKKQKQKRGVTRSGQPLHFYTRFICGGPCDSFVAWLVRCVKSNIWRLLSWKYSAGLFHASELAENWLVSLKSKCTCVGKYKLLKLFLNSGKLSEIFGLLPTVVFIKIGQSVNCALISFPF